jgi:hypothetical protein
MTPEVQIVSEPEQPLFGIANRKWEGCSLRDLDVQDLRFAKRFARHGGIRHEITTIMESRYWATHRRCAQEQRQNWRPRSEAR